MIHSRISTAFESGFRVTRNISHIMFCVVHYANQNYTVDTATKQLDLKIQGDKSFKDVTYKVFSYDEGVVKFDILKVSVKGIEIMAIHYYYDKA